ncbi:glycosyltransferase family 4 protein [Alteromonas sp. ASW11-19]|uniref:Glycosyltransferase family 4 protein n=1 Tax=Alteromonas salexigens TaxID=2982530 RepID=A0ABT2VJT4_9ALTE|nr:glycosyltransferase family 4 protein [Alteromonas salexigens]MCU7553369.1 glycosyltransferase family 4 protein [Alteromonas salexigens]
MTTRILHLEFGRYLYGGAKQVDYLISALDQYDDIEQHLACPEDSAIGREMKGRCKVHPVPYSSDIDARVVQHLTKLIRDIEPDLLHIHSRHGSDVWGAIASKITQVPAICTRRIDTTESALSNIKYSQFEAVVSISEGVKAAVTKRCPDDVLQPVIHSAVDIEDFPYEADREWLNKTFDVPGDHQVVANFAQLVDRKGQGDLILSMRNVLASADKVTCLLFGEGPQRDSYQSLIDRYELNEHVKLCGFSDLVPRILPNVDVVVHPAYAEGLGTILLQAGACRRMVIACPTGGIPEVIEDGETGVHVDVGAPDTLGEQIILALENPNRRQQLGENLYQRVAEHFTPKAMAEAYYALYKQVLTNQERESD